MTINRKSSYKVTPRNTMHIGNETGESKVYTIITLLITLVIVAGLFYTLFVVSGASAMSNNETFPYIPCDNDPLLSTVTIVDINPLCNGRVVTDDTNDTESTDVITITESDDSTCDDCTCDKPLLPVIETESDKISDTVGSDKTPADQEPCNCGDDNDDNGDK